jgi:hypothetical protein
MLRAPEAWLGIKPNIENTSEIITAELKLLFILEVPLPLPI